MADCPFIDPNLIDKQAEVYFSGEYDFCHLVGEFPSGLDTTIFNYDCLEKAWNEANKKSEREHITSYITNNPKLFKIGSYEPLRGLYHHRWVVDHPKDYQFAKAVYEGLEESSNEFGWEEIVQFLEHQPEIFDLNSDIKRDEGYLKSLAQDWHFHWNLKKFLTVFLGRDLVSFLGRNYLQKVIQQNSTTTPKVFWLPEFTKQKWWAWQGLNLCPLQCQRSVKAGSPPKLYSKFHIFTRLSQLFPIRLA